MPLVKLSGKSQIVLPADIRRRLGLKPGDVLQVLEERGSIVIRKAAHSHVDALEQCASTIWRNYEVEMEGSRAQWDS